MKKVTAIVWHSTAVRLKKAASLIKDEVDARVYSCRLLDEEKESLEGLFADIDTSDILILNVTSGDAVWDDILPYTEKKDIKKIFIGANATEHIKDQDSLEACAKANDYFSYNGSENLANLLRYAAFAAGDDKVEFEEPLQTSWEGIFHPEDPQTEYETPESFFEKYPRSPKGVVALLVARGSRINDDLATEREIVRQIEEAGYSALPVFTYSWPEPSLGAKGAAWSIEHFMFDRDGNPIPDALIKLTGFFINGRNDSDSSDILKKLGCPVFKPVCSYNMSVKEWEENEKGAVKDVGWNIALPEIEGAIEPVFIGGRGDGEDENRYPVESRVRKLTQRVFKWVALRKKPNKEKKCVFILNNNPCASVEATVGGGSKLDTLESVARMMKQMRDEGYEISGLPENGDEIIDNIMERKAISDFRWTTVEEISQKGGVLYSMPKEEYTGIFDRLPDKAKTSMIETWGAPPGEEKDGVPPSMVLNDNICITGVSYGNVLVCVQPKRGCAGSRCDGTVCKILHDPECPPTHQYVATYKYFEEIYKADYIVHVGTHGTLEFLPGKGTGLSDECFPDICSGSLPLLYVYNADNPPEATTAKRRALATIVDHMQTVFTSGGLYEELEKADQLVEQYELAKLSDPAQAHQFVHQIVDLVNDTNLKSQVKTEISHDNIDGLIEELHGLLTLIRNTQIQDGLHILGEIPEGSRRTDFLYGVLRYESGDKPGIRSLVCSLYGLELKEMLQNPDRFIPEYGKAAGALLEHIEDIGREVIERLRTDAVIDDTIDPEGIMKITDEAALCDVIAFGERVKDLDRRLETSTERDNLLETASGRFLRPGAGGAVTRGREEVMPTGSNLYTLDPSTVPTRAAWVLGQRLADAVLDKFMQEEKRYPETFGIYWMSNDILWSGGEGMAQLMWFIGARPKWLSNGKVNDFEIIPLSELKRPRIDISVKMSGILRDNFSDRMDILDMAIRAVAQLDESPEENYVRKHMLENLENGMEKEDAMSRIFGSRPGTYLNGTSLQVYASAWKDRADMVDVFTFFNGYSYGANGYGRENYKALQNSLKNVDITYNKVMSDESDLLGCCAYFGSQGGMTAAARQLSGKDVKAYYGDSREAQNISVRTLSEEINRVVQSKLFNPKWIEGMKKHGYKGAGDISKNIGRIYGWEATTDEVGDWVFDEITRTYIENKENYEFFKQNNPWALEEIERRLIEANKRGLWQPDEGLEELLEDSYLELEGILEESSGDGAGEFQGGAIDAQGIDELEAMQGHLKRMHQMLK